MVASSFTVPSTLIFAAIAGYTGGTVFTDFRLSACTSTTAKRQKHITGSRKIRFLVMVNGLQFGPGTWVTSWIQSAGKEGTIREILNFARESPLPRRRKFSIVPSVAKGNIRCGSPNTPKNVNGLSYLAHRSKQLRRRNCGCA